MNFKLFFCIFVLVFQGCAYRWHQAQRVFPSGIKKVSVGVFKNLTREPQLETYFTNALIAELEKTPGVSLVDEHNAEAYLVGSILSLEIFPGGRRQGGDLPPGVVLATEYRLVIRTEVSLVDKLTGRSLVTQQLQRERVYVAPQVAQPVVNTVNALYNHSARHIQIEQMARQMMTETFQLMTESF